MKKYSERYVRRIKNKLSSVDAALQRLDYFIQCSDGVLRPTFGDSQVFCGYEMQESRAYKAEELRLELQRKIREIRENMR